VTSSFPFPIFVGHRTAPNQYRERISRETGARSNLNVGQAGILHQLDQLGVIEPEPSVSETLTNPELIVFSEIQDEDVSPWTHDSRGLRKGAAGILRVMQRLRQHRDLDAAIGNRQRLELSAPPQDVSDSTTPREFAGVGEDLRRSIDGDHA
jgi:hypothetical protein